MKTQTARELVQMVETLCPQFAEEYARKIIRLAFQNSPYWSIRVLRGAPIIEHSVAVFGADDRWVEGRISVDKFFREDAWVVYENELDDAAKVRLAKTLERTAKRLRASLPNIRRSYASGGQT